MWVLLIWFIVFKELLDKNVENYVKIKENLIMLMFIY